jgi:hypothetical protein
MIVGPSNWNSCLFAQVWFVFHSPQLLDISKQVNASALRAQLFSVNASRLAIVD